MAKNAVDDFGAELKAAEGAGLFYFSGHGCESDGKSYLIPQGTTIRTARPPGRWGDGCGEVIYCETRS